MKTKIKEVQDYFTQKIYNCEFEIVPREENESELTVSIIIDKKFPFCLWMHNGTNYSGCGESFIHLTLTESKCKKALKFINEFGKPTEKEVRAKKLEKFNRLKKELNL